MLDKKERFVPGETITGRVIAGKRFKNTNIILQMIGMEHYDWYNEGTTNEYSRKDKRDEEIYRREYTLVKYSHSKVGDSIMTV